MKAHVRACWPGVIVEAQLAATNYHRDLSVAAEVLETHHHQRGEGRWVLCDRNYHSPNLKEALLNSRELELVAPYNRSSHNEQHPSSCQRWLW